MTLHSRPKRVAEEIKESLAQIIQYEVKDPRLSEALVTVSAVEVSRDLQNAQVHVSVLSDDDGEAEGVIGALEHCKGFIKRQLGQVVTLRFMPELHFKLDTSSRHAARIQELLRQIELEGGARAADAPSEGTAEPDKPDPKG